MVFFGSALLLLLLFESLENASSEIVDFLLLCKNVVLNVCNTKLHLGSRLLSLQSFSHTIGYGRLVQCLISLDRHLDFIPNSHQKEAALGTIDSYLSDNLIKSL